MNTSVGYEQSPRPPRVPLDEVMVKLYPEGFHQEFEADAVNVGSGGLSMRSSVLPQVGSSLRCRFEDPNGGEAIRIVGQVVWAHQSSQLVGEFGLRFTEIDVADHARIEDIIATWNEDGVTPDATAVRLSLDGVATPIVASVTDESAEQLKVAQQLPFLAIGTGVENQTTGRKGHLQQVELDVRDDVPRLVLSIGYELATQAPRIVSDAAQVELCDEMDTLQDEDFEEAAKEVAVAAQAAEVEDKPAPLPSLLVRARERTAPLAKSVWTATKSGLDRTRAALLAAWTWLAGTAAPAVWARMKLGAMRTHRFVSALVGERSAKRRRRRVQRSRASRAPANTRRNERLAVKPFLVGVAVAVCSWSGYHVWSSASETAAIEAAEATDGAPADAAPSAEPPAQANTDSLAGAAPPAAAPTATPSAQPAAAPAAPQPTAVAQRTVNGKSFGADDVPGAEIFVLRMNNPVRRMEGIIDDDGFSVTIPGALSLSRAGPIAAAHQDVERASILNRGDISELTLRFVAGRTPAYRVEAIGATIEISIAR